MPPASICPCGSRATAYVKLATVIGGGGAQSQARRKLCGAICGGHRYRVVAAGLKFSPDEQHQTTGMQIRDRR